MEWSLLLWTFVYNFHLFSTSKLVGNGASRTLVALGPMLGIGAPYRDLYEFAPPGYYMMISSWVHIMGMSMPSFRLLHATLILVHGVCVLLICRKLFPWRWLSWIVFSFTIIVAHSRIVQSDIFSVDLAATMFALAGLTTILYVRNIIWRLLFGSALLLMAAQMKDIYILTLITLAPLYLKEFLDRSESQFYKIVLISLLGPLTILATAFAYIARLQVMPSYIEVFKDKMVVAQHYDSWEAYYSLNSPLIKHFNTYFMEHGALFAILILSFYLILLAVYIFNKFKKTNSFHLNWLFNLSNYFKQWLDQYSQSSSGSRTACIVFVLSLLGGLTLYGQHTVDTRFIPVTTCLYLLIGILLVEPVSSVNRVFKSVWIKVSLCFILVLLIAPQKTVLSTYLAGFPKSPPFNTEIDAEIARRTATEDCILHVYGWEVSSTYTYNRRKPCTKYFLINHLSMFGKRRIKREYREQIFANPPAALIINTKGADFNIKEFEENVMNMTRLVAHCYLPDPKFQEYEGYFMAPISVYWPRLDLTKDQLKECVSTYGKI